MVLSSSQGVFVFLATSRIENKIKLNLLSIFTIVETINQDD